MLRKHRLGNQKGFTLIEIIAVLLLLGILAAVAVPKYFDLQEETEYQTLKVAFNDLKSRSILAYSKSILANDGIAQTTDQTDFTNLGLADLAAVTDSYRDFANQASGWAYATPFTTITYTTKYNGGVVTFTVNAAGDADDPMDIVMSAAP